MKVKGFHQGSQSDITPKIVARQESGDNFPSVQCFQIPNDLNVTWLDHVGYIEIIRNLKGHVPSKAASHLLKRSSVNLASLQLVQEFGSC